MSIHLSIPSGLRAEVRDGRTVYTGRAEQTRAGAGPGPVEELAEDDLVEVEWDDGATVVLPARRLRAEGAVVQLAGGRGDRDLLSTAIVRLVLRPTTLATLEDVLQAMDGRFLLDAQRRVSALPAGAADGILWAWNDKERDWVVAESLADAVRTVLVLVHGTFSCFREGFRDLLPGVGNEAEWDTLLGAYDAVYAFDHPTVTADPLANARRLIDLLPRKARITFLTHSRGGLVAEALAAVGGPATPGKPFDALARRAEELHQAAASRELSFDRIVRVACPARGTTLMSRDLDLWLNVMLNGLAIVPGLGGSPMVGLVKDLLLLVAAGRHDPDLAPGLEAMNPRGDFCRWLATRDAGDGALTVIAGEATGGSVVDRLADLVANAVFPSTHDLVVDTDAMEGGVARRPDRVEVYRFMADSVRGVGRLDHFSYFHLGLSRRVILAETASGVEEARPAEPAAPRDGGPRVAVALIPDLFGSTIEVDGRVWWPDLGGLLPQPPDAGAAPSCTASALLPEYRRLEAAIESRGQLRVQGVPYRWTRPVDEMVQDVVRGLTGPDAPRRVVAHGLGGVLLALALPRLPDELRRELRIVLLGVPLEGCWWAQRLLVPGERDGEAEPTLSAWTALDPTRSKDQQSRAFRALDAIWLLLPPRPDAAAPDLERRAWEQIEKEPPAAQVPGRDQRRTWFQQARGRMLVIAGTGWGCPTPGVARADGDGRVSVVSATAVEGAAVWQSRAAHGDLGAGEEDREVLLDWLEPKEPKAPTRATSHLADALVTRQLDEPPSALVPSRDELVRVSLGLAPAPRAGVVGQAPLTVEVWQAFPAVETGETLTVVGHPAMTRLSALEADLDVVMGGALGARLRAGRYPSALGSWAVAVPGPKRAPRCPRGVLVVGLGRIGDLTRSRLTRALTEALVETALPPMGPALWPDAGAGGRTLSFTLVGTGREGLPPDELTDCVLEAVLHANDRILREGLAPPYDRVRLVDLSERRARRVLERAQQWAAAPTVPRCIPGSVKVARRLMVGESVPPWAGDLEPEEPPRTRLRRLGIRVDRVDTSGEIVEFLYAAAEEAGRERSDVRRVSWRPLRTSLALAALRGDWEAAPLMTAMRQLLSPGLVEVFQAGTDLLLAVDPEAAEVPWEAFVAPAVEDGGGSAVSVLRQIRGARAEGLVPPANNRRALIVCCPGHGDDRLPAVEREAEEVAALLRACDFEVQRHGASAEVVRHRMTEPFEVIHLAGHGTHVAGDPAATGFVCDDGELLRPTDIRNLLEHHPPALLFANACHLGNSRAGTSSAANGAFASSFALAALEAGVPTVVAAGWPVSDAAALAFAATLYTELANPRSLRSAVGRARVAARRRQPASATWAAYQCYGDPEFVLPSRLASQLDATSDAGIIRQPVYSPAHAREVLARLWLRAQLIQGLEDPRRAALNRLVSRFWGSLPRDLEPRDQQRRELEHCVDALAALVGPLDLGGRAPTWGIATVDRRPTIAPAPANPPMTDALVNRQPAAILAALAAGRAGRRNDQVSRMIEDLRDALRQDMPHNLAVIRALQDADPGIFDDPNWGRFGGSPEAAGWAVHAEVDPAGSRWRRVVLTVSRPSDAGPSQATIVLHPTFHRPRRTLPFYGGTVTERHTVWVRSPFTIGVEAGAIRLELDLRSYWEPPVKAPDLRGLLQGPSGTVRPVPSALRAARDRGVIEIDVDAGLVLTPALKLAFEKAKAGEPLSSAERSALEAFVLVATRPALPVKADAVVPPPAWKALTTEAEAIRRATRATGRILVDDGVVGTGFLVSPRTFLTNNHVLSLLATGNPRAWQDGWEDYTAAVEQLLADWDGVHELSFDLLGELGNPARHAVRIVDLKPLFAQHDVAMVVLEAPVPGAEPLTLAAAAPTEGPRPVYVVGYPLTVPDRIPLELRPLLFGKPLEFGVKRISPGYATDFSQARFHHDASTLASSSGSCVIDLETHQVLGVHVGGGGKDQPNEAEPIWPLLARLQPFLE